MYQFTTTTILNSALDSNGSTAKYAGTAAGLNVTRVGYFKTANIVSIYKKAYTVGVKEIAHITIPTITLGLVARLVIDVRLSQQTDSEYANTYLYFKKPVVVEVLSTGTDTTTATALVAQINGLKDRYGFSYVTAATAGADIHITATNNNQRIYSIQILKEAGSTGNSIIEPAYEDVSGTTFHVATAGKLGFGDDEYMVKSIMLPTYENSRYFGTNKEERPILGANYSQYTLRYQVTKTGNDGIESGGTSVTTHVFYVPSANVLGFEAAIFPTGKNIVALDSEQAFTLTATDDTTAAVFIDISGIVPFVTSASEITATSSVEAKATIGAITIITPTGDPLAQTARIVLTKVAAGATTISVIIDGVTKTKAVTIG